MADFDKLDPETRCFALVGQFFQAWATMESSLHDAIGSALQMEIDKLKILCANIEFGNKIYILRTLIDISSAFAGEEKKDFQKELRELGEYSKLRNMVAHHGFEPDESKKGVRFFHVKAKGKYELPDEIWLPENFVKEGSRIEQYRLLLARIKASFDAQPLRPLDYVRALHPSLDFSMGLDLWPMTRTRLLGVSDPQSRQAQGPPGSHQASPEKSHQTPSEPEG